MVVEVDGTTQADGTILADQLHLLSYDLLGTLEALEAGQVRVDGQVFLITPESHLEPGLAVGDRVLLRVALGDDGVAMVLSAVRFAPPTPTAPALPTSVPAPTRSAAPPATATPESTDDSPQAEPTQDETEEVEETPQETPPTEEDESEEEGDKIQFEGIVESIGGSQWIVAGRSLRVDGETEIKDDPQVGDTVKVVAFLQSDGTWWAEKIELED
jgi:hypothetical protein